MVVVPKVWEKERGKLHLASDWFKPINLPKFYPSSTVCHEKGHF